MLLNRGLPPRLFTPAGRAASFYARQAGLTATELLPYEAGHLEMKEFLEGGRTGVPMKKSV